MRFDLVGELVVEELVEEDLGNDLELVAVIAQAVVGADALEVVDQGGGFCFEFLRCHAAWCPWNSARYSFITRLLMN